jgi:hypothetical protein
MRRFIHIVGVLCASVGGCDRTQRTEAETPKAGTAEPVMQSSAPALATALPAGKHLYLDIHDLGPGNVSLEAAAGAHQKDLATQAKYGANFKSYWVDEKQGKIYCLVEAPSAEAALSTHREAHGLMPTTIEEVSVGR